MNPKKGYAHTCKEARSIVRLIDELKEKHKVDLLCKVLGISRSMYYFFRYKKPCKLDIERAILKQKIQSIYDDSNGIYAGPKSHKILSKDFNVSIKRVQRIMRELGLKSVIVKKYKHHTIKVKVEKKDNILEKIFPQIQ